MYASIDGNEIKLYGDIWYGDAPYILSQIDPVLKKYKNVDVYVHGPGGSVIDGNMIMNAIKQSKAHVTMIVAGLAASMYSSIILSGDVIKMASNAFIMIHAPKGGAYGTKEDLRSTADVLESMEKTFLKQYAKRTSRKVVDLVDWMKNDNWFDADAAKAEGLIDEIIDPFLEDLDEATAKAAIEASFKGRDESMKYQSLFELPKPETQTPNTDMKIEATNLVALGLKDGANEAEINAAISKQTQEIIDLKATNKTLEDKARAETEARIVALVDGALKVGKITATQKDQYIKLATADYDLAKSTLEALPAKKDLTNSTTPSNPSPTVAGRDAWTFDDWRKKDPAGLRALRDENLDAYNALQR